FCPTVSLLEDIYLVIPLVCSMLALVMYSLVVLLGVPGNAVVVWVTGFCMSRSVTSLWFLNLALADLLCCLSIPLLMVPLVHDDHWHFGPLACMLIRGLFYLVMYCSILQLVVISVDRLLLVIRPIWCQNHRRPKQGAYGCVAVWVLALIGKCRMEYTVDSAWPISAFLCHLVVFNKTQRRMTRGRTRSKKTLRVIIAVVLSFFLCWIPLHIVDFLILTTPRASPASPKLHLAHVIVLCLAYFNSCLNPLLYFAHSTEPEEAPSILPAKLQGGGGHVGGGGGNQLDFGDGA
uniref:G-protein coupled receptors family 1 profile domain-containing protein n=1 Tax=Pundamilia nyererei TaxID=303518 RepID=A0A3B4G206_9CICH